MTARLRLLAACAATAVRVTPLGWLWWDSLAPDDYSVMDMGRLELGGGPGPTGGSGHGAHGGHGSSVDSVDIATLVADSRAAPDVRLDLVARQESFALPTGERVSGYTLNGGSPGPTLRAVQGDLVEVRLRNEDVDDGVTLHWHGLDVPNAMDGVAGVTQDAVRRGESFTYRFVAEQAGTYWYHSHQVSHEQVRGGLFGGIVIEPGDPEGATADVDVPALAHVYAGRRTVNGRTGDTPVEAAPGDVVRVRVVNTDNGPVRAWVTGADYRVVAVDGTQVNEPDVVSGSAVVVTAGGRADLQVVVPEGGARVELGGNALLLGRGAEDLDAGRPPAAVVDLLDYGAPAPTGIEPAGADRRFDYVIDRRPGFLDGRPGLWWTVNGRTWPDVPAFHVAAGDVVVMRLRNDSGEVHPMHLHGHHALVLSRDGRPATGSPWWVDSLNLGHGESYEIAFVADNPGVWMDHCHNLPHAAEGLVAHLAYAGHRTPFRVGGDHHNAPE